MLRLCAGLMLLAAGCASALAQDPYPARTVRIIVPSTAGATTDVLARVIGQSLSQTWGQPVIVDNRPGADERLGAEAVAKAPADGYTLLVASSAAITAAPHLYSRMAYDSLKDFTPILMLGQVTPVLNVPASSPAKSVQELIALAKARPGELNYGSFGNGSYVHIAIEDFKLRTGTQMMHIPYRGATPAITALLRSEIAVLISNMGTVAEHVKAGTVRTIAAAGPRRPALRPDLPTISESVPGFSTSAWWGMFGPAAMPRAVVDKIRAEVVRTLNTAEARKLFETNTFEPIQMSPEQFVQYIRDDFDIKAIQIKAAGIKPE